jgi:cytochrome c oxidase cbb3-type subunit 4
METYSLLREIADSWGMLSLLLIFLGVIVWVFRPGSKKIHAETANMIFRNEDKPKDDADGR